jgi:hypothetical protein
MWGMWLRFMGLGGGGFEEKRCMYVAGALVPCLLAATTCNSMVSNTITNAKYNGGETSEVTERKGYLFCCT